MKVAFFVKLQPGPPATEGVKNIFAFFFLRLVRFGMIVVNMNMYSNSAYTTFKIFTTMTDVYQMITDKMIEQLEKGIAPWSRPWTINAAVSHTNGKPYSLLNQFLLENIGGEWLTFKQIQSEGGSIIKGKKAHFVTFWSFIDKYETNENGEKELVGQYPILKYYNVWHITEVEGITAKYPMKEYTENSYIYECENVVKNYGERENLMINRDDASEKAFYSPCGDYICVPKISQYSCVEEYYSTLFHEMIHSSGAEKRLNRDGVANFDFFGSHEYSKEELIAEMGAAFLCATCGVDTAKCFDNSAAYIASWLKALKNDKKMVVSAAAKAEQAVKYILTGEKPKK